MVQPEISILSPKLLVGKHLSMCIQNNRTAELWKSFMPQRNQIQHKVTSDLISMQVYPDQFKFVPFNIAENFEKWAAVEVSQVDSIPDGFEKFELQGGTYVVFHYKGAVMNAAPFFRKIFEEWLPASGYELRLAPHFELLGEKYSNTSPDSEEEIWIPVNKK